MSKQLVTTNKVQGNFLGRLLSKRETNKEIRIKNIIDIENQIESFRQRKLDLIDPTEIYKTGNIFSKSFIYQHYEERMVSCTCEDQQIKLDLIDKNSYNHLKGKGLQQAHIGIVVIGVKRLHREGLGAKTLVCLYDDGFTENKGYWEA